MDKCIYDLKRHKNELGEEEVFCQFSSRWVNCVLSDCSDKCEHYCDHYSYLVRLSDKKEYWSEYAGRFINPYMKYPLTVFDTLEEAQEFAIKGSVNRRNPLLVCDINGKVVK